MRITSVCTISAMITDDPLHGHIVTAYHRVPELSRAKPDKNTSLYIIYIYIFVNTIYLLKL